MQFWTFQVFKLWSDISIEIPYMQCNNPDFLFNDFVFLVSRWLGSLFHPFESYCAVNERGCLLQPYRWKMVRCSLITVPWSFSWHPWDPIWYLLPLDDNVLFANKLSMFKSSDVFPIFSHPFSLLFGEILPLEFCPQSFQPLPKVFLEEDLVQWTRKTYKITVEVSPLVFQ